MLNKDHKSADFIYLLAEKIVYKYCWIFFDKSSLTPLRVTLINFFFNNLGAVFFFSLGKYWANFVAIGFIVMSEIWDWMDGEIARRKHTGSRGAAFMDPVFDFVWQNLMIATIIFGVFKNSGGSPFWLTVGLLAFVSLTLVNYCGSIYGENFGFGFRGDYDDLIEKVDSSKKANFFDKFCLELLVYRKFSYIFFFTVRYPLFLGAIFNKLNFFLAFLLLAFLVKGVSLIYLFFLYLESSRKKENPVIVQALIKRHRLWLKIRNE